MKHFAIYSPVLVYLRGRIAGKVLSPQFRENLSRSFRLFAAAITLSSMLCASQFQKETMYFRQ
jgi:hypothetical protein